MSSEDEAHDNINSETNQDNIYGINNMSLDEKKEKKEWRKREFESELEYIYDTKNQNGMTCIHENE